MRNTFILFIIAFFLVKEVRSEELSKSQIKEMSRKIFECFATNEEIKLDDRVVSKELKSFEFSHKLNTFRIEINEAKELIVPNVEMYDQISISDKILINRALIICSQDKIFILAILFTKINGIYTLTSLSYTNDVQKIIRASVFAQEFEKSFIEPEILKKNILCLSNQTIEKMFKTNEAINLEEIINPSVTDKNTKLMVTFIGGASITKNLNTCYYLIQKEYEYLFLRITFSNMNENFKTFEILKFRSNLSILEVFGNFLDKNELK